MLVKDNQRIPLLIMRRMVDGTLNRSYDSYYRKFNCTCKECVPQFSNVIHPYQYCFRVCVTCFKKIKRCIHHCKEFNLTLRSQTILGDLKNKPPNIILIALLRLLNDIKPAYDLAQSTVKMYLRLFTLLAFLCKYNNKFHSLCLYYISLTVFILVVLSSLHDALKGFISSIETVWITFRNFRIRRWSFTGVFFPGVMQVEVA